MDLKSTRRRGQELETAILDAAWEQLVENGYGEFTFESVAARAGTSRPVLYRRWTDRTELMMAAIKHGALVPVERPNTGNLREDVITLITRANEARAGLTAALSVQLAEYFRESGTNLNDLRALFTLSRRTGMEQIVDQAAARGELDPSKLTPRVIELPFTLMRHELLLTLAPVPSGVIEEIVDDLWLPMLRARGALL